jgi:TrmH family RNA methyltransferase
MTAPMTSPRAISSRRHPLVLACRRIASGRGDPGEILLDGDHLVDDALAAGVRVHDVFVREAASELVRRAEAAGARVHHVTADVIAAASPVRSPGGVVGIATWQPLALAEALGASAGPVIALVDVQDPGNVGSVIRSADALGASAVVAAGATADPGGWRALRAAMGSTFRVPVSRADADALFTEAHARRARIIATTIGDGEPLDHLRLDGPAVVLLGNEGAGLPDAIVRRADARVQVPMRAGVNSLNVAVTAALILYAVGRPRA